MATKKTVKKTTNKRGVVITLPGSTSIIQSNRITNGKYLGLTLLQSKLLVTLIKQLQTAIQMEIDGRDWKQLNIFENSDKSVFKIGIPLNEVGTPNHYKEITKAAKGFTTMAINIQPPTGYESVASLVARVDTPVKESGKSIIYLYILRGVGEQLIIIDKTLKGAPMQYTKYTYEVAMNATNKYTLKLYWLICSWKVKGGFKINYDKLREQLGLSENEYLEYNKFKQRILIPAQNDLEKKADCWFNCKSDGFEEKQGQKVVNLNFKIITPEFEEVQNKHTDNIKYLLKEHLAFTDRHIERIQPIFKSGVDLQSIQIKILELFDYLKTNNYKNSKGILIQDVQGWVCVSILNEFAPK